MSGAEEDAVDQQSMTFLRGPPGPAYEEEGLSTKRVEEHGAGEECTEVEEGGKDGDDDAANGKDGPSVRSSWLGARVSHDSHPTNL